MHFCLLIAARSSLRASTSRPRSITMGRTPWVIARRAAKSPAGPAPTITMTGASAGTGENLTGRSRSGTAASSPVATRTLRLSITGCLRASTERRVILMSLTSSGRSPDTRQAAPTSCAGEAAFDGSMRRVMSSITFSERVCFLYQTANLIKISEKRPISK